MKIELEISPDIIANMMISAMESGDPVTTARRGGWCAGIYLRGEWEKRVGELKNPWYSDPKLYKGYFTLEVFEVKDESKEWDCEKRKNVIQHRVNQTDIARGLQKMAKVFPHQFAEVIADNTDAPCADAFLQSVLFGDEKYA